MNASLDWITAGATPAQVQTEYGVLRRTLDSASALAREMTESSSARVVERQSVDVNLLIAEIAHMLRRVLRPEAGLEIRLGAANATVFARPLDLERILLNLTLNASKAMTQGGALAIRTESLRAGANPSPPDTPPFVHYVRLTVSDTGCGLSRDVKPLIANPLKCKKADGMGLASVSLLVMRMNGKLRFDSEPGGGTTFSIDLPVLDGAE